MKRQHQFALLWALVVVLVIGLGASQWLGKRIALDTDILALLPSQERDPVLQQAFAQMVDSAQQKMIVLVGSEDWEQARSAADAYRTALAPHADLLEMASTTGVQAQQDWLMLFQAHRMALMTSQGEAALHAQPPQHWVDVALARLYSPFNRPQVGAWQDDPFGLFGDWIQARVQETPVRPRDGYLFVADSTRQYVVMPITLRVPAFSMNAQQTVTPLLARAREAATDAVPGVQVLAAGAILHAAAAGRQATTEMTTIGVGSLIGIMLLVWVSFRSLRPIAYILILIGVGCLGALSVCLLLFERVHLLTLVFGATLIGVAQDYGIYFLCQRVGAQASMDSSQLLRKLLPSLCLAVAAAMIGYLALAFTPFPGLRQMAVFSVSGLLFAWLTVMFWFPAFIGPQSLAKARIAQSCDIGLTRWPVLRADRSSAMIVLAIGAIVLFGWSRIDVNDDIRALQNPPQALLDDQLKLGKLLDAPTPVQFYLVRGTSAELVLQREEALKHQLDVLVDDGALSGYQAISNWVPSAEVQEKRHRLIKEKLMANGAALPLLAEQIDQDAKWVKSMQGRFAAPTTLTIEAFLNSPASAPWRHLWLNGSNAGPGGYASIVALRGVSLAQLSALEQAAADVDGVQWVDKVAEISSVLGRYRQYMGWMLLASYVAVFALLSLRYRGSAWRVLGPTAAASAVTIAALGIAGYPLQLFHILALMLVLGIGVDYGVFFQERSEHRGTLGFNSTSGAAWLAVCLSAASTVLAFGLLALSKTPALQAFGLTMLLGTTLVWLIVPCFSTQRAVSLHPDAQLEDACEPG